MIKIENNDLDVILNEYKILLKEWLDSGRKKRFIIKSKGRKNRYQKMLIFVDERFNNIIECKPDNFNIYIEEFKSEFKVDYEILKKKKKDLEFDDFKKTMGSFYSNFFKYKSKLIEYNKFKNNGSWLASRLNLTVCPYCNRQYTFTIDKGGIITRPQFDHFMPKSIYPFLALSFYNLIPSCPTCNKLKSDKIIDVNPYNEGFGNKYKFKLVGENIYEKGEYKVELTNKPNKNIETFGLELLYNEHKDYIDEILDKRSAYNESYYDSLIESYKGLGKQPQEIDRFIWGAYLEEAEHGKRPLSKLTRDILDQLGIK